MIHRSARRCRRAKAAMSSAIDVCALGNASGAGPSSAPMTRRTVRVTVPPSPAIAARVVAGNRVVRDGPTAGTSAYIA